MILMLDNYDSFTYNLVQYLGELGAEVEVHRNDEISLDEIEELDPDRIVLSPGPCTPNEAGVSVDVVQRFGKRKPLLGVCLGHQCIGQAFGGKVDRAHTVMHGKLSTIRHDHKGIFSGVEDGFTATRYHSLVVRRDSLPPDLTMTAWSETAQGEVDEIMGIRHNEYPIYGVQFHPESIKTAPGHDILRNFLRIPTA
ncbi:MAG: aminodeoxychorismate/anthranilate synthase component II [Gammaproteobacteria bacterium]|nr:aminodeoxychorismate/anthranilate synthase component II [Gammaproteobacteria bacterium]